MGDLDSHLAQIVVWLQKENRFGFKKEKGKGVGKSSGSQRNERAFKHLNKTAPCRQHFLTSNLSVLTIFPKNQNIFTK